MSDAGKARRLTTSPDGCSTTDRSVTVEVPATFPVVGLRSGWWCLATVVVAGLAVGTLTQILQGVLPDGWSVLANSGAMWAVMAFALGSAMPTKWWAAGGGAVQLIIASLSYYVAVEWFEGISSDARGAMVWSAAGLVAGPVFGLAGFSFSRRPEWRLPSLALVAGVLIAEGVRLTWFLGHDTLRFAGITEMLIAAGIVAWYIFGSHPDARPARTAITVIVLTGTIAATLAAASLINTIFSLT